MTIGSELETKIENLIVSLGYELYGIDFLRESDSEILRVYITKQENISLDDCQEVSLALSPLLDVELPNYEKYYLEVSSPGIERVLKKQSHYKGAIGEMVKIKTISKEEFKGKLINVDDNNIELEGGIVIPISNIKKAQTFFIW